MVVGGWGWGRRGRYAAWGLIYWHNAGAQCFAKTIQVHTWGSLHFLRLTERKDKASLQKPLPFPSWL